ncbi:hypothetical protein [Streptomyces ipomoeae]|uniref:hypothetical protein n=1 Tax=Streptomyces ipomoeae TaxID=103232 RepID=UPI001146482C|nr:hypothetical protein [Streptomyces ipomoeae]MDX2936988.1 hypothetical protein [Streptomyces ipomoeae]TQE20117.1 hypothetical protein SipoB123_29480 [Streptomyces ipomoeae]
MRAQERVDVLLLEPHAAADVSRIGVVWRTRGQPARDLSRGRAVGEVQDDTEVILEIKGQILDEEKHPGDNRILTLAAAAAAAADDAFEDVPLSRGELCLGPDVSMQGGRFASICACSMTNPLRRRMDSSQIFRLQDHCQDHSYADLPRSSVIRTPQPPNAEATGTPGPP